MIRFTTRFIDKFFRDDTTTLAASLAFYTALSLAPLLILFVTLSAQLSDRLQDELLARTREVVGEDASLAVQMVIEGAKSRPDLTSRAGWAGALTLLISASLIFGQLRTTLNRVFDVEAPVSGPGVLGMARSFVRERLAYVGFALAGILSLTASLLVSSYFSITVPAEFQPVAFALNVGASFVFYASLFTVVFRYLPDRRQPWRQALRGGAVTAALFEVGKEFIAAYLGRSAVGSAYGAAGSLIALLVWVYYSTLITFIGAQISTLWNRR